MEPSLSLLHAWESFYVIVGSSAAALTGLQFVVITLVAERGIGGPIEVSAFGTPTVVHFCAVLLLSAILSAPWHELGVPGHLIVACGLAGVIYVLLIAHRARSHTRYRPVLEDWIWHVILPFIAYATLMYSEIALGHDLEKALFLIGASSVLLLFIGIHNAWDTIIYVLVRSTHSDASSPADASDTRPSEVASTSSTDRTSSD